MSRILILTLLIISVSAGEDDCGPNEVYISCGPSCYPTCQRPSLAGTSCLAVCVKGCFCRAGFIRDERTKKCVRPFQCNRTQQ